MKAMQIEESYQVDRSLEVIASDATIHTRLEEIEGAIIEHPGVKDVAVVEHKEDGESFIVAYLVADLQADRVHWESECRVQIKDGPFVNLTTVDLSANGVGLRDVPTFFQTGQEVRCTLQLPTKGLIRDMGKVLHISVSFQGRVAWYNIATKRAGILFLPTREQQYLLAQSIKLMSQTQGIQVANLRSDEPRVPLRSSCLVEFERGPIMQLTTENISPDGLRLTADQAGLWNVGQQLHLCLQLPTEGRTLPPFAIWPHRGSQIADEEPSATEGDQQIHQTSLWIKGSVLWCNEKQAGIQFELTTGTQELLQKSIEYITANQGYSLAHLRRYLSQRLSSDMIPSIFVLMETLPRTANGQLDHSALPPSAQIRQQSQSNYVPPHNNLQWELSKIWEYAFDMRPIGVQDNFFKLGGQSLQAIRIFTEIKKIINKKVTPALLFNAPTIEKLSILLSNQDELQQAIESSLVPIQPQGANPPFFLVPALGHNLLHLSTIARHLAREQPFYALQLNLNHQIHTCLEDIAAYYIKQMQTMQPAGPYFIGGYCAGGVVAYEMAQQLRMQHQPVALLALIASDAPPIPAPRPSTLTNHPFAYQSPEVSLKDAASIREKVQDIWQEQVWGNVWRMGYKLHQAAGRPLPNFLHDPTQINSELLKKYVPQPYPDQLTLFQAAQRLANDSHTYQIGWDQLATNLSLHDVPGDQISMWKEPNVKIFAEKLCASIKVSKINT